MIIGQRPSTGARRLCTRLECQGRQRTDVRTCTGTNGQTEATRTYCDGLLHRPALFPSPSLTLFPFLSFPRLSSSPLCFSPSSGSLFWYTPGHCHSPACLVSHFPSPLLCLLSLPLLFSSSPLSLSLSRLFSCVA